jgi:serine/threonine protein kinase
MRHENVVAFYGLYAAEDCVYIVTEYVALGSVLRFLKQNNNKLTLSDLVKMAKDTAAGMAYLEMRKIVHRDLRYEISVKFHWNI